MKFSAKFEYALLALLYLKCEPDEAPVSGKTLSEKLNIPYRFLEQILSDLKKAGLTRSVRGYQGGYTLNRGPEEISLYDIFQVTEGKMEPWDCGITSSAKCGQDHNFCVINQFYADFKSTFSDLLKSYTLARLCAQNQALKMSAGLMRVAAPVVVGG
ncbi:MAG: Rrf2 family transcriptional regulator [Nitrospinae bacterium]|nr:Rrf2 family transcriptional regulator [Nitrospinota bacterium]